MKRCISRCRQGNADATTGRPWKHLLSPSLCLSVSPWGVFHIFGRRLRKELLHACATFTVASAAQTSHSGLKSIGTFSCTGAVVISQTVVQVHWHVQLHRSCGDITGAVVMPQTQTDHNLVKVLHGPLMSAAFGAYSRILQNVFHVCRVFSQGNSSQLVSRQNVPCSSCKLGNAVQLSMCTCPA